MRFLIQILSNALAILLAAYLIDGISFSGDWTVLIIAGLILGLINFFVKPILKLISAPIILLSLGTFTVIINMVLLSLVDWMVPELSFSGFWALFWGVILMSLVNFFISALSKK